MGSTAEREMEFIKETEVSQIASRALSTLRNDRHRGRGIPYYKIGKSVRYRKADVYAFLESRKVETKDF